ncbi:glycosyltransferase family 2 protein [Pseudobacteriovorax antillogorgiicola]|uniref:Glycosyltransferase involved in cell wall bisynthesis n=1 Tax=Pseudobacteriovorax antillogorgiicola TaxID=1513793 RepID=A0A1Y6CGU0_9BACT|nr:glycosyltransferase family 2 protein [Pseudobacteriovorax antillogorgiicola]TCS46956.1 glycosyltransferase involved in cell wall biosynthesis [Pseudobacteriovorax antillogorgiicola]SMF64544.1 Glycosyltransferase involved in cell wall bisynthesis [Pseudobacteriovorax antillogorgiicola]
MKISVVAPIYNERENIKALIECVHQAMNQGDYELILVDDGSSDGTPELVRELAHDRVKLVELTRNFGQTAAMAAGIELASGRYIATIDGDLQNDPSDIPAMIAHLDSGRWDIVAGRRAKRKDGFLIRKLPSRMANYLIRRLTNVTVHDLGCTLKAFRREFAKNLGLYGELHRFIPVLAEQQGARILEVDVKHHPRLHGQSKYGLGRTTKVMSDLILMVFMQRYLRRPIHLFGPLGILCAGTGTLINLYLLVIRLMGQDIWGRPLLILGAILFLAGLHFLSFGVLLEVQMRTYFESQKKRTYTIRGVYFGKEKSYRYQTPETSTDWSSMLASASEVGLARNPKLTPS